MDINKKKTELEEKLNNALQAANFIRGGIVILNELLNPIKPSNNRETSTVVDGDGKITSDNTEAKEHKGKLKSS